MIITNENHPEFDPVTSIEAIPVEWDGDLIRITRGPGKYEIKEHYAPVDPGPAPTYYKVICPSSNDLRLFGLWKSGVSGSVCGFI
ncbi:MAG: hypothetical protein H6887_14995 [Hoeflea sp.]|nr:hypothetical protein [Hoeflea sp.]